MDINNASIPIASNLIDKKSLASKLACKNGISGFHHKLYILTKLIALITAYVFMCITLPFINNKIVAYGKKG